MNHVEQWPALPPDQEQVHPFAPPPVADRSAVPASAVAQASHRARFHPADARIILPRESLSLKDCPMPWEDGEAPPHAAAGYPTLPVHEPAVYGDEYLCDGGDRGVSVHYRDGLRHGLDTEDTVAEFVDDTGTFHTRPSTRVCIYAPQFAAVRSATLPQESLAVDRPAGAHRPVPSVGLDARLEPGQQVRVDQPIGLDIRSRASELDLDSTEDIFAQVEALQHHVKLINIFEDRLFLAGGQLAATTEAVLAYGAQAAGEWTRDLNPVIVASDSGGQELITVFHVEEYIGDKDMRKPGKLRIIKLADKETAQPGEIVTFTIRYENLGDRPLHHIRVIDNLTPRLEFIEGSADSSLNGRLTVEDNDEGSLVLRFELEETLPGKSGGTVTFQARVR